MQNTRTLRAVQNTVARCLEGFKGATAYLADNWTVKATRQFKPDRRNSRETILVTVGRPNYAERKFIKLCRKAGEPFPVRKIQLRAYLKKNR